jgi:hypothetical protein
MVAEARSGAVLAAGNTFAIGEVNSPGEFLVMRAGYFFRL